MVGRPSTCSQGTLENFGETRGGVGKSGVLEHKSGNSCETREDRGKVTTCMKGLLELADALSDGTIPDPNTPFPRLEVRNFHPKLQSLLSQERVKL